ncbi:MAG: ABC transporter substrate-binding protein [Chloroflexota bacterium]
MFRLNSRPWRIAAFSVLMIVLLGGAFGVHAQTTAGVLRIGVVTPKVLDPSQGSNDSEVLFNRSIYDYLVEALPDRSITPNLAKDWTISADGLTYTFNLQEGVKFHDGSDFSSADVVFTFNRLISLKSPALDILGEFEVSAPDAKTVVFTLKTPNADFLYGVSNRFALILKDGMDNPNVIGDGDNPYASFNGTGPFVLTSYDSAAGKAVLTKNANYWKEGQPLLDSVEFVFIDDPATQVQALRGGQVDFIYKISLNQVSALQGDSTISVIQKATNQHPVIRLRTDEGPGKDVKVRQAFKLATDRQLLNEQVLDGQGIVGNNDPIGPSFGVFYDSMLVNPGYDPGAACDLLTEAGYPDGIEVTLVTPIVLGYDTDLAPALKDQWEESAGCIKVNEIQTVSEGDYYNNDFPNNWLVADLAITPWSDQPTAQSYLVQAYKTGGVYNETRWSDPDLDKLIDQAGVTTDATERAKIYNQISDIFNERGPIIIPWFAPIFGATSTKVQGLDFAPFPGLTDLRGVSVSA